MTHIHLDAIGGIAGDMFVASLLDALPDLASRVFQDAAAVLPMEAGTPFLEAGQSGGIAVRRFGLRAGETPARAHADTTYRALAARLGAAALSPGTAEEAAALLRVLSDAEARIHGVALDEVHFHEIADWDSLLDIVAAGSIAAALRGATWSVSGLPRGGGTVRTAHGLLPVPAPATIALLEGFLWRDDGISGERVTPTGAAILRHLVRPGARASGVLRASGTGAGTRQVAGLPNVLRTLVFEAEPLTGGDVVAVIAFEVDDMTGEEIGTAADRLRAAPGVLDLSIGQRSGKKGRPLQAFRLLAKPDAAEEVAALCLTETSTIGLRIREERRIVLDRTAAWVGHVRTKSVLRPDGSRTTKAESDDLDAETLARRRAQRRKAEGDD